jgi:hypothetical protein
MFYELIAAGFNQSARSHEMGLLTAAGTLVAKGSLSARAPPFLRQVRFPIASW